MTDIVRLHGAFLECTGACTDTRQIVSGSLFFALKGPSFNANAFAQQALDQGCRYAVVDEASVVKDERFLLVPDVLKALQELGRHHRRTFTAPVLAITGTNGKTTTKELVHAVMNADRSTLATTGNLNNHIGVPLTLLRLKPEHHFAIIEMGANHIGDIAELVTIAEPTHGMITNIGKAHLEGFGSYEGVIKAKTEMYAYLRSHNGSVFVNADDALLMSHSEGMDRISYGTKNAWSTGTLRSEGPFLAFSMNGDGAVVKTRLIGDYNLPNALAAVCIGRHFGVADATIEQALSAYAPSNNRSQFTDTGKNHVIMDAYNANPSSMRAALLNFAAMRTDRIKLAVLGDMLELGNDASPEHEAITALLRELNIDAWLIGPEFMKTQSGANYARYASAADALGHARAAAPQDKLILVKGSRGIKLETLLPAF
jgi:UDP-N-acetylmuramoyl-tripeptide--D-alanyl-D-alanine ligase